MLHLLLLNESFLHYLSITCVTMMVFCVSINVHLLYVNIYFCLWWSYLWWALILHVAFSYTVPSLLLWWLSVFSRYKTDLILCVVEFTGLYSHFLVCKLQLYIVKLTVFDVNVFTVFCIFTKLFWQPQLPKSFCKNNNKFFTVYICVCVINNRLCGVFVIVLTEFVCTMQKTNLEESDTFWQKMLWSDENCHFVKLSDAFQAMDGTITGLMINHDKIPHD